MTSLIVCPVSGDRLPSHPPRDLKEIPQHGVAVFRQDRLGVKLQQGKEWFHARKVTGHRAPTHLNPFDVHCPVAHALDDLRLGAAGHLQTRRQSGCDAGEAVVAHGLERARYACKQMFTEKGAPCRLEHMLEHKRRVSEILELYLQTRLSHRETCRLSSRA